MFSDDCRDAFTKEQEKIKSPLESENSGIIKKEDKEISPDVKAWLLSHKDCDIIAEGPSDCIEEMKKLHDRVFVGKIYFDGKDFYDICGGGKAASKSFEASEAEFRKTLNKNSVAVKPECEADGATNGLCDETPDLKPCLTEELKSGTIKCKAVKKGTAFTVMRKEEELSRLLYGKKFDEKLDDKNYSDKIKSMSKEYKNKTLFANILGLVGLLLCFSTMFLWWFAFPKTMESSLEMFWLELFLPYKPEQRRICKLLLLINIALILAVAIVLKKKSLNFDNYNTVLTFTVFAILFGSFFVSHYVDFLFSEIILEERLITAILRILVNIKGFLYVSLPVLFLIAAYRIAVNPLYLNFRDKNAETVKFLESADYERYLQLKNEIPSYTVE